ncbi:MAG: VTT domain-containing protein [Leadbetterella sp.]|nr:VTT domain-containing protein [Leadbetterella sp.]
MQTSKLPSILSFVGFTLLPLFSTTLLSYYLLKYESTISTFGLLEWLALTLFLTLGATIALCPPTFLAIVFGYFMGFKAIPYLLIINFGAIFLIYVFYKILDFKWIEGYFEKNEKIKNLLKNIKADELKIIFFAKLSPILPFALTNLTFAVSGAKLRNILIGGFGGMLPRTLLAVYTGSQAKQIRTLIQNPNEGLFSKILVLLLIIVSVWGITHYFRKAVKM